jgi:SET domain-containing protein
MGFQEIMNEFLEVRYISAKKGKGVFAKKDIKKDRIIDIAHVVPIPNKDYKKIRKTILYNYCYIWEDPKHMPAFRNAITLSISQFINHSFQPNVKYLYDYENKAIEFSAIRDINKGEEISVNYNGLVEDQSPMWFEVE